MKKRIVLILAVVVVLMGNFCFAETVYLKNGSQVQGKILDKNDSEIKVEVNGIKLTYYLDEIDNIDGTPVLIPAPAAVEPVTPPADQEPPDPVAEQSESAPGVSPKVDLSNASLKKEDLIRAMIEVSGARQNMEQAFEQIFTQASPEEATLFRQMFRVDEIVSRLVPIYDKYFTEEELQLLVGFFRSEVAAKLQKVTPLIMEESMQASLQYFEQKVRESGLQQ